ncbi:hypothetical protein CDL15_Pgr000039 [Punica granatum]|uniref:Uncharacterized protein n=1 Tax=Punica granatum TaxID=22663 RepID=A0A218VQU8_PUNGR|nr:hypothetical protein CDL15_Pgr000039 [Punica granatum]
MMTCKAGKLRLLTAYKNAINKNMTQKEQPSNQTVYRKIHKDYILNRNLLF